MGMETPELNLDQKGEMVQGIFSKIARKYDTFNALSSMGIYKAWLKRVALTAACTPQERVLDVAGGTGDVSFELCRRCPPASVEVSDFTPEMLEVARSRAEAGASCGVPCAFKVADAMNLPYDDESFDVLTMAYGLRNFSDRKRAMREAARVLKPGGRAVILEFGTPPNAVWRAIYHVYLMHVVPAVGGAVCGDCLSRALKGPITTTAREASPPCTRRTRRLAPPHPPRSSAKRQEDRSYAAHIPLCDSRVQRV